MADRSTVRLDKERAFRLEVMCKDLISWLEVPNGSSGWKPAFTTVEEWEEWWEGTAKHIGARAYQGYHWLATAGGGKLPPDVEEAISDEALGLEP